MKKIFKLSLFAMLTAMPMMANAAVTDTQPTAGNEDSPTAVAPKYALKGAGENDSNAATAGYVKGAYNAVIKGINATSDEIDTLNSGIETYSDAIGQLTTGKATQDGTVATIKNATTTESINDSTVNITGVTTTSISATASGNVNLSIPVMDDWTNDSAAANPIETTASFSGLTVDNLTMSAPTTNTATLTKPGITGDVDVVEYLARMTPAFDFTPLINVNGNSFGWKSADGKQSRNATGLSNGEWWVKWNAYGTVKGTTMCSSTTADTVGQIGSPSSTDGRGCWCKMTAWTPKDGTETPAASLWVHRNTYGSAGDCVYNCALNCGDLVNYSSDMRSPMFSNVQ